MVTATNGNILSAMTFTLLPREVLLSLEKPNAECTVSRQDATVRLVPNRNMAALRWNALLGLPGLLHYFERRLERLHV
jgi:hypothetical protein